VGVFAITAGDGWLTWIPVIFGLMAVVVVFNLAFGQVMRAWMMGWAGGAPVEMGRLVRMRLRGIPVERLVGAWTRLRQAGCDIALDVVVAHHQAGGDPCRVAEWLTRSTEGGLDVAWDQLAEADLAGNLSDPAAILGTPEDQAATRDLERLAAALQAAARQRAERGGR